MKRILPIILMALAFNLHAQSPETLVQQGNDAYNRSHYDTAIAAYNAVLDAGYESATLYYNLGNAYYRQEEYGQSILNYERALRLKPNYRDAKQNLDLVCSKTEDEIAPLPELFIVQWGRSIISWFSPRGWRILLLCLALILGTLLTLFILSNDYRTRRSSLIAGIVILVLIITCSACSVAASIRYNSHNKAIVTSPMVVVKSSPETGSIDKLVLHEGTKVDIQETIGEWHKIHIADGNTGWVEQSEITII